MLPAFYLHANHGPQSLCTEHVRETAIKRAGLQSQNAFSQQDWFKNLKHAANPSPAPSGNGNTGKKQGFSHIYTSIL